MSEILTWLNGVLAPVLPYDIYSRLDLLYNSSIILLGAGVILMLFAMIFMILAIRSRKKHAARA